MFWWIQCGEKKRSSKVLQGITLWSSKCDKKEKKGRFKQLNCSEMDFKRNFKWPFIKRYARFTTVPLKMYKIQSFLDSKSFISVIFPFFLVKNANHFCRETAKENKTVQRNKNIVNIRNCHGGSLESL